LFAVEQCAVDIEAMQDVEPAVEERLGERGIGVGAAGLREHLGDEAGAKYRRKAKGDPEQDLDHALLGLARDRLPKRRAEIESCISH
jgi:hypothetical protein